MEIPDKLYKYQFYSNYALESLIQQRVWISDPKDFNDPFDCKVRFEEITNPEQIEQLRRADNESRRAEAERTGNPFLGFQQTLSFGPGFYDEPDRWEHQHQLRFWGEGFVQRLTTVGVYSLTSKKTDLLMWAHYADDHRGFVVGFDTTNLDVTDDMQIVQVHYGDEYDEVTLSEITDVVEDKWGLRRKLASRKGSQWANEAEWRLVFPFKHCLTEMPMLPVEIIFGYRMEEPQRGTLRSLMTKPPYKDVNFLTAEPSPSEFRLEICPVRER